MRNKPLNKEQELASNELDRLDNDGDLGEGARDTPEQTLEQGFKELCQIEMSNGSKIILGSCTRPVETLCSLATELKEYFFNGSTKSGGSMVG